MGPLVSGTDCSVPPTEARLQEPEGKLKSVRPPTAANDGRVVLYASYGGRAMRGPSTTNDMGPDKVNEGRGDQNMGIVLEVRGVAYCERPLAGDAKRQGVAPLPSEFSSRSPARARARFCAAQPLTLEQRCSNLAAIILINALPCKHLG